MAKHATQPEPSPEPSTQYYIGASTSLLERRPRTLKHGDTFALFDHYGDIPADVNGPMGIFHNDTRHLSRFELSLEGYRPLLLSSTLQDDNAVLTVDLANPDIHDGNRLALSRETMHLVRSKFLWRGNCYERLALRNYDQAAHRVRLGLRYAADFADLFEVRGAERPRRGEMRMEQPDASSILFRYSGLDGLLRTTRIDFEPAPARLDKEAALFDLVLAPHRHATLLVTVRCNGEQQTAPREFFEGFRLARHELRRAASRAAAIDSSDAILNRVLCRSIADLYMLLTDTPQGPYPYAGIPWFSTAFGRDGIITALQMLWVDPEIARGVLRFLAANQARDVDPARDAEPGKILHETRRSEMARLGEVPFGLYYGSVDATPLFVLLAARYFARTGDRATLEALWPSVAAALGWIDTFGDADGDGFVEYRPHPDKGLTNQGWKDSQDSISHADGSLATGAIALCEVQAYVYAAKREIAAVCRALGHFETASQLEIEADALRVRFEAAFWCEELGTYAIALDGEKRACEIASSNAGHALFAGIASPEHARRVARTLFDRDSFSGWGVRTLAASARRYNPMSYHNGSVWPHDNALIGIGLSRYGLKVEALDLFDGIFEATKHMELLRPPELFCGFSRRRNRSPTLYPVACSPQAWAAAAPLALLEACLGLRCDYVRREIRFEQPMLPQDIGELRIRRLRLGEASVDVLLHRHASDVAVNVLARRGDVRVVVVN
ncbi:MAG TPA: amylo-alpha-1,6-glucosidase [Stellaceae bacterium]|nr:amylo-alpha-1,6-glucosidase [Stellaceae bacterium]